MRQIKANIVKTFLTIIITAIVAGFIATISAKAAGPTDTNNGLYAMTAEVISLEYDTDTVVVEDATGNEWSFYGIEDYYPGDLVSMVMDNNGTPENIYDDIILSARYSGYAMR